MTDAALSDEITAIFKGCEALWGRQDYAALRALWDPAEAEPWYVAEEVDHPMIGWAAIDGYFAKNPSVLKAIAVRYSDIKVKRLAPDLALALFTLRWDARMAPGAPAIGGDNRATAIFRKTAQGWRFCHYVEAPIAPIVYMRKLYERDSTLARLNATGGLPDA